MPSPRSQFRLRIGRQLLLAYFLLVAICARAVNSDENKVHPYQLPDPLRLANGQVVTNAAQWFERRRPELLELFQTQMYGRMLPRPRDMSFQLVHEDPQALSGRALRRDVLLMAGAATNRPALSFTVYLPAQRPRPVPVFVGVHLFATAAAEPTPATARQLPHAPKPSREEALRAGRATADQILARGYGFASLDIEQLSPDSATNYWLGAARLFGRTQAGPPGPEETGALGLWAWGLIRALDYFETLPEVDARRVIVVGHSRMGKTALWAAANDQRFAMAISNDSGCGGAALSKRDFGETVEIITRAFPHWFCGNFRQYAGHEENLPMDQHELIALIAPRPVYVASAVEDKWADPRGEFLAALGAEPVYRLLNAPGLETATWPEPDHPVGATIGYHLRHGQHDLTDYDWEQYLNFADRHFAPGRTSP